MKLSKTLSTELGLESFEWWRKCYMQSWLLHSFSSKELIPPKVTTRKSIDSKVGRAEGLHMEPQKAARWPFSTQPLLYMSVHGNETKAFSATTLQASTLAGRETPSKRAETPQCQIGSVKWVAHSCEALNLLVGDCKERERCSQGTFPLSPRMLCRWEWPKGLLREHRVLPTLCWAAPAP